MRGINLIGILIGVIFLIQSYGLVRRREESVLNFLVWFTVGTGLIVAGLFPGIFGYIMNVLGMEERAFAMFAIGIFIAYLLLFRVFNTLKRTESELSQVNEELSLLKLRLDTDQGSTPQHDQSEEM